jgi:hypothetical protein
LKVVLPKALNQQDRDFSVGCIHDAMGLPDASLEYFSGMDRGRALRLIGEDRHRTLQDVKRILNIPVETPWHILSRRENHTAHSYLSRREQTLKDRYVQFTHIASTPCPGAQIVPAPIGGKRATTG